MESSTGLWVSGDDFFDRKRELQILKSRVCQGNHVLLTGQRRMCKTSLTQELGRQLRMEGWTFLFIDSEGATCPEDVIADITEAVHPIRSIASLSTAIFPRPVQALQLSLAMYFRISFRLGVEKYCFALSSLDWIRFPGSLGDVFKDPPHTYGQTMISPPRHRSNAAKPCPCS